MRFSLICVIELSVKVGGPCNTQVVREQVPSNKQSVSRLTITRALPISDQSREMNMYKRTFARPADLFQQLIYTCCCTESASGFSRPLSLEYWATLNS